MNSYRNFFIGLALGLSFLVSCKEGGSGLPGINTGPVQFANFADGTLQLDTVGSDLRAIHSLDLASSNVDGLAVSSSAELFTLNWDPDTDNEGENQRWVERPNAFDANYSELRSFYFGSQLVLGAIQLGFDRVRLFNVSTNGSLTSRTNTTDPGQSLVDFGVANSRSLLGLSNSGSHPIWNTTVGTDPLPTIPGSIVFASPIRVLTENFRNRREDPDDSASSFIRDFILIGQNSIGLLHQDGNQNFRALEEVTFGAGVVAQDAIAIDLDSAGRPGILIATNQGLRYYRNISTSSNLVFELMSLSGSAAVALNDTARLRAVQTDATSLRDVVVLREGGSLVYFRTTAARSLTNQTSSVLPASLPVSGTIVDITPLFFTSTSAHDLALVTSTGQVFTLVRSEEDE